MFALDKVPNVEFVMRANEQGPLLNKGNLMWILGQLKSLQTLVYWARTDVMWISPDFEVKGWGKSRRFTLTKTPEAEEGWDEERWDNDGKLRTEEQKRCYESKGWKQIFAPK